MKAFLDMGGYAAFIWPAYGVTLAVLVLNIIWARGSLRRALETARRRSASSGGNS
ncbi:MAG: heme exporter protein CcmD [Steroidobacterales bacterium]|jgi:heme exporter protein D